MMKNWLAAAVLVGAVSAAYGQTSPRIVEKPWGEKAWGETDDNVVVQEGGHVKGEDEDAQVFFWESEGRFRFGTSDPHPFTIGYRWANVSFDTDSEVVPDHLDDISLAAGVPVYKGDGERVYLVGGAGFASDSPFSHADGLYGIGHLVYERAVGENDSLFLTVDYNGNRGLLPDVPLPGVAYVRRGKTYEAGIGFPDSWVRWEVVPRVAIVGEYSVPFTGEARVEVGITKNISVFGGAANFFNPFQRREADETDRLFFQMARAEVGVRFSGEVKGFLIDVAVAGGYAFEQNFYEGWDVRELDEVAELADRPYVGVRLIGRF